MSTNYPSAVQVSGKQADQSLYARGFLPASTASIAKFRVVVAASTSDDCLVTNPANASALNGGKNFVGIATADRTVDASGQDASGIEVQVAGIARCSLRTSTACKKGDECGYDPSLDGLVEPITALNRGRLVPIGRFDQSKSSSADVQSVGVVLLTAAGLGRGALASVVTNVDVFNTAAETIFTGLTGTIPANRISTIGQRFRVHFRAFVTGGNANDTLQIKAYLGSVAAGNLLGQTPAVDVTNAGGDKCVLDLECAAVTVGAGGSIVSSGFGGISPGQAVATGGNVQSTGNGAALVSADLTAAQPVIITATWSAASAANVVTSQHFSLEVLD